MPPPPPAVVPDVPIDRSVFAQTWRLYALPVAPRLTQNAVDALKKHVLRVPRIQTVAKGRGGAAEKLVLLRYFVGEVPEVPPALRGNLELEGGDRGAVAERLRKEGEERAAVVEEVVADGDYGKGEGNGEGAEEVEGKKKKKKKKSGKNGAEVVELLNSVTAESLVEHEIQVGYEQWSMEAVLTRLLPEGMTIPSSYESVGHIAHINLRPAQEKYKGLIATVLLDKLRPRIRTVVNKTESTGGPYRTFAMEVLAGEANLVTSLKENGCNFTLDFSKVYWNSRLETEHRRIVNLLTEQDVLVDAFCGIGPFVIPARRMRRCSVYANDLNPSSVEYLKKNADMNGVSLKAGQGFKVSCGCARELVTKLVREEKVAMTRLVMNFPSGAPEFLDVFCGLYAGEEWRELPMPTVHCYCFARGDDWRKDAKDRVRGVLGLKDNEELDIEVREVRDVAPKKIQVCVSFVVPESVAYRVDGEKQGKDVVGVEGKEAVEAEGQEVVEAEGEQAERKSPEAKRQKV